VHRQLSDDERVKLLCRICKPSFWLKDHPHLYPYYTLGTEPPYWSAESGGFGAILREYGFYPRMLPLCIATDHAPRWEDAGPLKEELESSAPCQLYHNKRYIPIWHMKSQKPVYRLSSPFAHYRRSRKIVKAPSARGTLAFFAHSTPNIKDAINIDAYIDDLLTLPAEFQPVHACIHYYDIQQNRHLPFIKRHIPVFTVGHIQDARFASRFYNLLKNYQYSTSSVLGSYTFYSTEMDIPFFLHGERSKLINTADPNHPKGEIDEYARDNHTKMLTDLFSLNHVHKEDKLAYTQELLSLDQGITRIQLSYVLYLSFLKWIIKTQNAKSFFYALFLRVFFEAKTLVSRKNKDDLHD